jgi:hypothetical protein
VHLEEQSLALGSSAQYSHNSTTKDLIGEISAHVLVCQTQTQVFVGEKLYKCDDLE